jgi:hypothetical protein
MSSEVIKVWQRLLQGFALRNDKSGDLFISRLS